MRFKMTSWKAIKSTTIYRYIHCTNHLLDLREGSKSHNGFRSTTERTYQIHHQVKGFLCKRNWSDWVQQHYPLQPLVIWTEAVDIKSELAGSDICGKELNALLFLHTHSRREKKCLKILHNCTVWGELTWRASQALLLLCVVLQHTKSSMETASCMRL